MLWLYIAIGLIYITASIWLYQRWKDNQIEKQYNSAMRKHLSNFALGIQHDIKENEKLIAKAMDNVNDARRAVANKKIGAGLDDGPTNFHEDPELLAACMTALIYKYGDMSLTLDDMKRVGDDDTVSVYVDTATQTIIFSTKSNLEVGGIPALVNFPGDDETYH